MLRRRVMHDFDDCEGRPPPRTARCAGRLRRGSPTDAPPVLHTGMNGPWTHGHESKPHNEVPQPASGTAVEE
jgi:hypothetical protein